MDQGKRKLATSLLAAASLTTGAASVQAVTYAEIGDAGSTLATAQATGTNATTALTAITGTLGTFTDSDLYILTITNTTTFSATATSTAGIDTSLFLFSATGVPIIANDDANGTTIQAGIPAGNSLLTTLAAGRYYLGISLSGNEPVNLANQQLFTVDQPTTNVRGIASGLNPTTLATFNGQTFFNESGAYAVTLTGANTAAAVPEPSAVVTLVLGAAASLVLVRRVRRQQAA